MKEYYIAKTSGLSGTQSFRTTAYIAPTPTEAFAYAEELARIKDDNESITIYEGTDTGELLLYICPKGTKTFGRVKVLNS